MNKRFIDTKQQVVVKILTSEERAQKEISGAKAFAKFTLVPEVVKLDRKTILIGLVKGIPADKVKRDFLNALVVELVRCIFKNSKTSLSEFPNIYSEINILREIFENNKVFLQALLEIEKSISGSSLFPVHGDLQKQNVFIQKGKMVLIDFEHFVFAPLELEIVNSLFFKDYNCMDVDFIISKLVEDKIFSPVVLKNMLIFYALRQMAEGRKKKDCEKRLQDGLKRLRKILGTKTHVLI